LNCDAAGVEEFCPRCGQKRPAPKDYFLRAVLLGVFERVTQYDGRLFRTLRALALRPGQLARDHYDGKRARNVAPFELFVIFNIAGWLTAPHLHIGLITGSISRTHFVTLT